MFFIKANDDVVMLLASWDEMTCKNPSRVIVVPKEVFINDDEDDLRDVCLHNGGGGLHNSYFNVDFLKPILMK